MFFITRDGIFSYTMRVILLRNLSTGFIEGKTVEREEVTPQALPEMMERKKSIKPTDKKSSISNLKRKSRVNVKVF